MNQTQSVFKQAQTIVQELEDVLECIVKSCRLVAKASADLDNGGKTFPIKKLDAAVEVLEEAETKLSEQLDILDELMA